MKKTKIIWQSAVNITAVKYGDLLFNLTYILYALAKIFP